MRILLVEDEARLASAVERYLRESAFAVDVAGTGKDAIFLANVNPYDAIVLDIGIPEPDGFEVLRRLRERGNAARVLILTARDGVEDRIHGLELGADDYLVKPFALGELRARLRALLRRGESLTPDVLRVADLELDGNAQKAVRGGRAIPLTAKEYALLEYLVRNEGKVVGRAEISDKVWDERYDPASNLIEVYINRLRRKVDAEGAPPLIHTRRGAGYVLSQEADGDPG
ncbi:response regulator transcription factor [Longimicrobium terrae]|jgi:DNA-binding response OmpR family regulator|uniref:Two-component system copper resistance phosphate regulon response regulator CusR n=1 Tax=Longimicrobium terrae TaxID=1639882 RepID=A0A841H1I2_9BACT|nr:response regulator transcription factor [Longimicrobium terrae]MBB4637361.1 two-component system copper resistance phosphate regulon response regulator CusR [Longimicrobium terrae]MBB6071759.1 two-component system copper resistance phosphate regulon response regulator CusR [Longimicrobium terrae]NNC28519.1 response regulator transcription factor [Longimicrobium terrae]